MTDKENEAAKAAPLEEIQQGWHELRSRVGQLEAENSSLEKEAKTLRSLLERVIDHRQKSHNELVLLLTGLVSKLPLNDVGGVVAKLVEHSTNTNQYLAALIKGTVDAAMPQPVAVKAMDQTKRELAAALKPVVEELLQSEPPVENELLQGLVANPEQFFSPRMVRANRCFTKGYVPRERVVREFGEEALVFFNDLTTDPKLNPRPKSEEIVLGFKSDFEATFQQNPGLVANKRQELLALHQRIQRSKAPTDHARAQKNAFLRLSFLIELLHFYEHQSTEAPDVIFAQRLPNLVEQLVLAGPQDKPDEKLIALAEGLMAYVVSPEHRLMVINNVGKSSGAGKTLRFILRLRFEKTVNDETFHVAAEFVRHLLPAPPQKAAPETLTAALQLLSPEMQRVVVRSLIDCDRIRKEEALALGKTIAASLGLKALAEETIAAPAQLDPQTAWARIKDMIGRRSDPGTIAAAIRERLNAKYDADEIRQSWLALTEADSLALIRICCQLPYLPNGKTDPIARTVLETYVSRLTHEKYAATYHKVVNSLKTMFTAKPDNATLVNFMALVKWASPEAANKLCTDVGMPAH
ncbi:MAG TPA: hypothetical protein VN578_25720 [Candidatus Binatia bacterium]|jgi:hypothetical protein|nr:hypothetical protein [Candidatus Binatia bacterium]